jgi:hypothetical protein
MLLELDNYDWHYAFAYAGEPGGDGSANISPTCTNPTCPRTPFTREDVAEIFGLREGERDERNWELVGRLHDGRYFRLSAGCDYTGWGCQEWGEATVSATLEDIILFGLTAELRDELNLHVEPGRLRVEMNRTAQEARVEAMHLGMRVQLGGLGWGWRQGVHMGDADDRSGVSIHVGERFAHMVIPVRWRLEMPPHGDAWVLTDTQVVLLEQGSRTDTQFSAAAAEIIARILSDETA